MDQICRAALYGWIIGDALGVSFRNKTPDEAIAILSSRAWAECDLLGDENSNIAPGDFSNNIVIGLEILSSLIQNGVYDQKDMVPMYHEIISPSSSGKRETKRDQLIKHAGHGNHQSISNDFLTRIPPLIIYYVKNQRSPDLLLTALKEDLQLTHSHPDLLPISIHYANILRLSIETRDPIIVFKYAMNLYTDSPHNLIPLNDSQLNIIMTINDHIFKNTLETTITYQSYYQIFPNAKKSRNSVLDTYKSLICCLHLGKDTSDTLLSTAALGGDAHSNCAVIGAVIVVLCRPDRIYQNPINHIPTTWILSLMIEGDATKIKDGRRLSTSRNLKSWQKLIF